MRLGERFAKVRGVLDGTQNMAFAVLGLACAFTMMGGMRLNTLDGVYPVEASLVVRHVLGMIAAAAMALLYRRRGNRRLISATPRRVFLVSFGCFLSLLLRYSDILLMASNPAIVLMGKLFEEFFTVLLILAWAERIVVLGFERSTICFACAVAVFGCMQILFSFFQRVPCAFMLTILPFVSAALFKAYRSQGDGACGGNVVPGGAAGQSGSKLPVDFASRSMMILYYVVLGLFVFIAGQMISPTLEIQRQGMSAQLSIAIGNAVIGAIFLLAADGLSLVKTQPRFTFAFLFLVLFAIETIAFALMEHLNDVSVTVYLALVSFAVQICTLVIWIAPFVGMRAGWSPVALIALGYACNILARALSCTNMLVGQWVEGYSIGIATICVLALAFVLCLVFVARLEAGAVGVPTLKVGTPFKNTIAAMSEEYRLTLQESHVLELLAKGRNARSVSEEMSVSLNTTKSHMRSLYAKLGVHSQQELVKLVDDRRHGRTVV